MLSVYLIFTPHLEIMTSRIFAMMIFKEVLKDSEADRSEIDQTGIFSSFPAAGRIDLQKSNLKFQEPRMSDMHLNTDKLGVATYL